MEPKTAITGLGVIGAAAAGIVILAGLPYIDFETPPSHSAADDSYLLCLKSPAPFFEDVSARCYSRDELLVLADAPVTDNSGQPVSVTLSHPTDAAAENAISRTCGVYFDLKREGWFALSSREQRREAYFIRACGALALMMEAGPAEISHFADGSLSNLDIVEFFKGTPFGAAPLGADKQNDSAKLTLRDEADSVADDIANTVLGESENEAAQAGAYLETEGGGQWRIVRGDQLVFIQELALADFDGDDTAEMLVFIQVKPVDGTAAVSAVGLLEKDLPEAQLSFRPSDYASS